MFLHCIQCEQSMVKHGFKAKEKSAMVQTLFKTTRPKTKLVCWYEVSIFLRSCL